MAICLNNLDIRDRIKTRKIYRNILKDNPTFAEKRLVSILKENKIEFIFQKRLNNYFYDFLIKDKKLFIEIDGGYHNEDKVQINDLRKEQFAIRCGYKLIRFTNEQIFHNINTVLEEIKRQE